MNTKALRQKILDLAIHGKLLPLEKVEQIRKDEPASILLEKIRADRTVTKVRGSAQNGKSKRDKNDSFIFVGDDKRHYEKFANGTVKDIEDEIPFEVPEGWSWCRFSEATKNRDSERKPVNSSNRKDIKKIYDYYGATGVIDKVEEYLFDEKLLLIGEDGANLLSHTKNNAFIAEGKYWVNNHAHVIDCFDKLMLDYICHYINSLLLDEYITGSAQPKLTQKALNDLLLPLPPLAEQKLIVEEIEKIFAQIDGLFICDGKVDGKVPIDMYKSYRQKSIHNPESNEMTLGKYDVERDSVTGKPIKDADGKLIQSETNYIKRAGDTTYFDMGEDWEIQTKEYWLDKRGKQMFKLYNRPAIDDAITRSYNQKLWIA